MAPVAVGLLLVSDPGMTAYWVGDGSRSMLAAATAVAVGIALTSALVWLVALLRFGRLVKAAERIAGGDYTVTVPTSGGGLETRLALAINGISTSLADTYDRATIDRLTSVANRQALMASLSAEVERARMALRSAAFGYALAALAPLIVQVLKSIVGA